MIKSLRCYFKITLRHFFKPLYIITVNDVLYYQCKKLPITLFLFHNIKKIKKMKHALLFLSFAAIAILSCNNETKEPAKTNTTTDTPAVAENKIMIPKSICYATNSGKDSVNLKVEIFENVVTGKLSYKLFQKDSNTGDFEGKLTGDTLLADYKFMSEGKQSTRPVIFLLQDSVAIEGYGTTEEKDGKMVFKNRKEIAFGKGLRLHKVDCNK
jgi:hypothetical protein